MWSPFGKNKPGAKPVVASGVGPAPATDAPLAIGLPQASDAVNKAMAGGCQLDLTARVSPLVRVNHQMRGSKLSARYGEFLQNSKPAQMQVVEQLVPLLTVPRRPSAAERWADEHGHAETARALLKEVPPNEWGYFMPLAPGLGTLGALGSLSVPQATSRWRSLYRLNFIMDGVSQLVGGRLDGLSLLDIACNWGAFAIEAALRGAQEVDGFDIRTQNIERARRLSGYFGTEARTRFSVADVYAFQPQRSYDIVLNLGLMYHITKPYELVRATHALCNHMAVFDTVVHREPFSGFILGTGEHAPEHAATATGCELHPTYRALIELAYLAGFKEVIELKGEPDPAWAGFNTDPYGVGQRRCIVAFK
ncbi:methyltransferase domain-containing protein [Ideonella sp. 4Y11]|uniref:Methyltransferase domain-containing protein n=1 Tax=Ideonella aquatica TaxID=2824119 RepID=A0A940YMH7_9BURK|nr:class I SAM-dependent methyltransferase [Ideonella aquatica]MBQ0959071.1 methyltransferase domain-containing protein [Ideonella aquatica]